MNILNKCSHFISRVILVGGIGILSFVGCGGPLSGIESIQSAVEGKPVYAVGLLKGKFAIDYDFLQPAPYLLSQRSVEMYAYVEKTGEADAVFCGSEWTGSPDLKIDDRPACAGKRNRRSYVPNRTLQAQLSVVIGEKEWSLSAGWVLIDLESYAVQPGDIVLNQRLKSHGGLFYFNQYCIDGPQPECERLKFETYRFDPKVEYVIVGAIAADGKSIGPYTDEKGEQHFYIAPLAHLSQLK